MVLQTIVGPRPLFQFLDPIHSRKDLLRGDQPEARPLLTQENTNTDIHDPNGIRTHNLSVRGGDRKRTIPTARPQLVSEVSANFLRIEGVTWSA
jgi:hypothetical protein